MHNRNSVNVGTKGSAKEEIIVIMNTLKNIVNHTQNVTFVRINNVIKGTEKTAGTG